jgi:hypothetical protein
MNVTPAANPVIALDLSKLLVARDTGPSPTPIADPPFRTMSLDTDPSNRYATIKKDGKTIATVYRSGFVETPHGEALPNDLAADGEGLSLANQRIQQILNVWRRCRIHSGRPDAGGFGNGGHIICRPASRPVARNRRMGGAKRYPSPPRDKGWWVSQRLKPITS